MLSGVSRLTLSLVVVLFELTGGLTYVVPFMLAVLSAKWTGDFISNHQSIYDVHATLKGFTKVELPDDIRLLNATVKDIQGSSTLLATSGGSVAAQTQEHTPLLISRGCVLGSDLLAHCKIAGAGFAAVSVGPDGEVEVLG